MLSIVVEGDTDLPVARKLAADAQLTALPEIDCGGKAALDRDLSGFNAAAKGSPWFVLRDLDHDADCAPGFLVRSGFSPSRWMCFRLAVREIEAWLLADASGFARFFRVDERIVPKAVDELDDPTLEIVSLARRSASATIRRAMIPAVGHSAAVGPLYETRLIEFGSTEWNLRRACRNSPSLRRARMSLRTMAARWRRYVGSAS